MHRLSSAQQKPLTAALCLVRVHEQQQHHLRSLTVTFTLTKQTVDCLQLLWKHLLLLAELC
jgi:hypothetical protein